MPRLAHDTCYWSAPRNPETFTPMNLDRRESGLLAIIVLSWAMIPLSLHFLTPTLAEHTGPTMMAGLVVGGFALVVLLRRAARRLDRECQDRLSQLGFEVVGLDPRLLESWIPMEHREPGRVDFDGFTAAENPSWKEGYRRDRDGVETHLFGYRRRHRPHFTALRCENPRWSWPEFSCAVGSFGDFARHIDKWERIRFDLDPGFSKACRLEAPEAGPVVRLFGPNLRRLALEHPRIRIFASGRCLTLYSDAYRLIPGEAEAFLDQAETLATAWVRAAKIG